MNTKIVGTKNIIGNCMIQLFVGKYILYFDLINSKIIAKVSIIWKHFEILYKNMI